jgi:hypothetical protein
MNNMDLVLLVEGLMGVCVIAVQVGCFIAARRRSLTLTTLFPDYSPPAEVLVSPTSEPRAAANIVDSTQIRSVGLTSPNFANILSNTNQYLQRNAGTTADFRILQDIAERVSNAAEHAAASNANLPLYIGLMGTFIGVIVGLVNFAGVGPSSSDPAAAFTDPNHLRYFLGGVLIAMSGSLSGLFLTVINRTLFLLPAQAKNDRHLESYLTLLQTELLPAVGRDFSSALYNLQQNLQRFNLDFGSNVTAFSASMGVALKTLGAQRQILDALQKTDVIRIIEANVELLKMSESISITLRGFVEATKDLKQTLETSSTVAATLNSLLDRFAAFERSVNALGDKIAVDQTVAISTVELIREQLDTLRNRTDLIRQAVASEDTDIKRYIEAQRQVLTDLLDSTKQQLDDLTAQIVRSLAERFGDGQGAAALDHLARLPNIDAGIRDIGKALAQTQQLTKDAENSLLNAFTTLPAGVAPEFSQHLHRLESIDNRISQVAKMLATVQKPSLEPKGEAAIRQPAADRQVMSRVHDGRDGLFWRITGWFRGHRKDNTKEPKS